CCHSPPPQDAAVRPVIAAIRASRSILVGCNVGVRTLLPLAARAPMSGS
ncbi:MAG: hypothetical protein ACI91Z_001183, partial [Yoonia sp.]